MRWTPILIAAFTAALLAQEPPLQKPPTFASGTQVVQVDVRVFDKSGHFVTDLKPEDFQIKEDGVLQPIVSLTLIGADSALLPATGSQLPASSSQLSASGSQLPASGSQQAGVWLFLFDTVHLSPAGLTHSRSAVTDFVNQRMQQGDLAGVIADGKMINNRLTTDREELARAVDGIRLPGDTGNLLRQLKYEFPRFADELETYLIAELNDGTAMETAVKRACSDRPDECPVVPDLVRGKARDLDSKLHDGSRNTLDTLRALSHGLARMPGPKTIVYLSEGFMLWNVQSEAKNAIGEANRAGAHVYSIDARGLDKGHNADLLFAMREDDPGAGPRFDEQVDGPNSLAIDTGGMFIQNENNLGRALDTIQQDAGTYYVVGYTPTNQAFDGKYRSISVSAKRSDVKVRARRGYLALEPAQMLKPVAITTTSAAPALTAPTAASATAAMPPAPALEPVRPAPESASPAVSAAAVRTRIDKGGLVATLRGTDTEAAADPASLGWAAYETGDVESAMRQLAVAASDPAAHPWVHYVLGLCHLALNEYPQAAASWEHVRGAAPAFEPVYFNLADAYLLQNDEASALRVLDVAVARWPSDAELFNAKGVIQLRSHAVDDAIDSFIHATKLAPADPIGFYNLASAHHVNYLRLRRPMPTSRQFMVSSRERDLAIDAYRRVVKLHQGYVDEANRGLKALNVEK